jgi:hypothetical protein
MDMVTRGGLKNMARRFWGAGALIIRPPLPIRGAIMSVQALSWVFDHSKSRLAARHVLLSIANHARADGTGAWPSIPRIARESGLSCREVYRSIDELVALGELSVIRGGGRRHTNLYSLKRMTTCHGSEGETVTSSHRNPDQMSPEPSLTVQNRRNRNYDTADKAQCRKSPYRIGIDGIRVYDP